MHIESFEELFKTDIPSITDKDGLMGISNIFNSLMWLSHVFCYQEDHGYRRLAAVALHFRIQEIKKHLFIGEWGRLNINYLNDVTLNELDVYRGSQQTDCFLSNLDPSRQYNDEWVLYTISTYLKCLEYDVFRALSKDGNSNNRHNDIVKPLSENLANIVERATSNFTEIYSKEYLMGLAPILNSQLYQKDLEMTGTTFYDLMVECMENKEKDLFLKLSTLSYMGVIADYVEKMLSVSKRIDEYSLYYPYTRSPSLFSEKEMIDDFNKKRRNSR